MKIRRSSTRRMGCISSFFGRGLGVFFASFAGISALYGAYIGSVYRPDSVYVSAIDGFVDNVVNPLSGVVGLELQKAEFLASPALWLVMIPLAILRFSCALSPLY